ncbi:S8 family serine peptidase [Cohnella soli]|uniref:S8 family serine peptidase n=1 Tax=Cohnella soli TaxID=425005 RepID=A0ABW0HZJ3_9BACL
MRYNRTFSLFLIMILAWTSIPMTASAKEVESSSGYLIKYKDIQSGVQSLGSKLSHSYQFLPLVKAKLTSAELLALMEDQNIEYIEADSEVSISGKAAPSAALPESITPIDQNRAVKETAEAKSVKIAIIDTGIASDYVSNVKGGSSFTENGALHGDDNNHGTYIASIVNHTSPNAELYDLEVLDKDGKGSYSKVIEAIEWAISNKMDIVQMSFGGQTYSRALAEAVTLAEQNGILLVAAAGNRSALEIDYPAKFNSVIAVGALDKQDVRLPNSNQGTELQLMALGTGIDGIGKNGKPLQINGTSAAVSQVVAIAANVMAAFPTLSAEAVREQLRNSAQPLGPVAEYGYGKVKSPLAETVPPDEQVEEVPEKKEMEAETLDQGTALEHLQKLLVGESLSDSPEEVGRLRLEAEQGRIELERSLAPERAQIEADKAKLGKAELVAEFGLDEQWVQEQLDKGLTAQEIFYSQWEARENAGGPQQRRRTAQLDEIVPVEPINKSLDAQSEVASDIGEHIQFDVSEYPVVTLPENTQKDRLKLQPAEELKDKLEASKEVKIQTLPEPEEIIKPISRNSEAPYQVSLHNETVSMLSGSVSISEDDLTLPGRSGLSFTLGRSYDSGNSQLYDMDAGYNVSYGYKFDYILTFRERSESYNLSRIYSGTTKKYACTNGVPTGGVIWTGSYGNKTVDGGTYSTMQALNYAMNNPPGIPSVTVHTCDSYEPNRMYVVDYTYSSSSYSTTYSEWTGFSTPSYYGPSSNYTDIKLKQFSMRHGYENSSGTGGSNASGYYQYQISYSDVSDEYQVPTSWSSYNTTKTDVMENRFPIGKGWRWNVPYLKFDSGRTYVGLTDGSLYEVSGSQLKNYSWSDLSFVSDNSVSYNGKISTYALKSTLGLNQYFDSAGNIIAIKDGYDNMTKFAYSSVSPYGEVLASVTDAAGNILTIQYSGNQVVLTAGGRTVTYSKTTSNGKELLAQVKDPMNRITTYSYDIKQANFSLIDTSPTQSNPYALLTKVTHPTGARTEYAYETTPVTRYIGYNQVNQVYRLASRKDVETYSDGTTKDFNYSSVVYSGDMGASYGSDTTFFTTLIDGLLETKVTYLKDYIDSNIGNVYYQTESQQNDGQIGQFTTYTYDQVKRRVQPLSVTSYTKNLTSSVTTSPVTTSQTYDDFGNILTSTTPQGITTTNTVDPVTHRLVTSTEPVAGGQVRYMEILSRNAQGDITESKLRSGKAAGTVLKHVQLAYDTHGNITLVRNKEADRNLDTQITYSGDYQYAYPTEVSRPYIDAYGVAGVQKISATYNGATGQMASFTDGNGHTTSYSYDALGRVIQINLPNNSIVSTNIMDSQNEVQQTNETGIITYAKWNALGLPSESGFIENSNKKAKVKTGYDAYARAIWQEDAIPHRTVNEYDKWNRVTATTQSGMVLSTTVFNDIAKTVVTTDTEGRVMRATQDQYGRTIKQEQQMNGGYHAIWTGTYDNANRLLSVQAGNMITQYQYDVEDQLVKAIGADLQPYSYEYNRQGQQTATVYPDENVSLKFYDQLGRVTRTVDAMGQSEYYTYDGNDNVSTYKDRKGQLFTYVYDSQNHMLSRSGPTGSISYSYLANGQRATMTDNGNQETSYSYDPVTGELTQVTYPDDKSIQYVYDAAGKRTQMTTPFGDITDYVYDDLNRLQTVKWNGTQQASYTYEPNGPLSSIQQANGITTKYGYDDAKRLWTFTHQRGVNELDKLTYSYDGNQNIATIEKSVSGGTSSSQSFTYDAMNRISTSSQYNETYTYDKRGNRASVTTDSTIHDPSQVSYEYDQWNRLIKANTEDGKEVEYVYNGDDLMIGRKENGVTTRYYYDGSSIIAEGEVGSNQQVTQKASYLYGLGLVMREDDEDHKSYYVSNGHGDITELRDDLGILINSYAYDIWGNILTKSETVSNPFRYAGEYWDDSTNLQYLRTRWYDPSMGRFINEDTYKGQIDNPLTLNLYTYVSNNPLIYTDPSGHKEWLIHGTWSDGDTWTPEFVKYVEKLFDEPSEKLNWSGGNSTDARENAAKAFVDIVYTWHKEHPDDPIRLIGHSHGGNVAIMLANLLAEKGMRVETLITIATPVREYQLETEVGQHIQLYNIGDGVQVSGGSLLNGGKAGRKFEGAENVKVDISFWRKIRLRPIDSHSIMHSNIKVWQKYIEPRLKNR